MTATGEQALVAIVDAPTQINATNAAIDAPELTNEESAELAALESIVQVGQQAFLQVLRPPS